MPMALHHMVTYDVRPHASPISLAAPDKWLRKERDSEEPKNVQHNHGGTSEAEQSRLMRKRKHNEALLATIDRQRKPKWPLTDGTQAAVLFEDDEKAGHLSDGSTWNSGIFYYDRVAGRHGGDYEPGFDGDLGAKEVSGIPGNDFRIIGYGQLKNHLLEHPLAARQEYSPQNGPSENMAMLQNDGLSFPNSRSDLHDLLPLTSPYNQAAEARVATARSEPPIPNTNCEGQEPKLSAEQQNVVNLILQGHNVFYTGSAGCGKSTVLKAFVKRLNAQERRVRIVAPTNLAALNVNGQTTWNFAGWTPDSLKRPLEVLKKAVRARETESDSKVGEVWDRFDKTDVLVIDEISMVDNHMFERLSEIMKAALDNKHGGGPFGGVQLVVTGDFYQLSPVKPFQFCIDCGWQLLPNDSRRPTKFNCENPKCSELEFLEIDKWAFRSRAWEECNFKHIHLSEIHRQSDKKFISVLQRIRIDGKILKPHANLLLNHASETEGGIRLFPKRADVDRLNKEKIAQLPSPLLNYKCVDHFQWQLHHREEKGLEKNSRIGEFGTLHALKDHRYDIFVQLKQGMRVVLQANLDVDEGLVNGSQGTIIDFEGYDKDKLPRSSNGNGNNDNFTGQYIRGAHSRYAEEQIKLFAKQNGCQSWPIVQFDCGLTRTIFADCTVNEVGNEEEYSLLSRAQIPLVAGYAITIHKSQGMTLDRVIVNLAKAFEPSQTYVALSRARSLKGLKVEGLPRSGLGGANAQVKEFMEKHFGKKRADVMVPE